MLEPWQPLQSPVLRGACMAMVSGHLLTCTVAGKAIALLVKKLPSLPVTMVTCLLSLPVMLTVAPDTALPPLPLEYSVPAAVNGMRDIRPPAEWQGMHACPEFIPLSPGLVPGTHAVVVPPVPRAPPVPWTPPVP